MFDDDYKLESGPQRREPDQLESWEKALDEISGFRRPNAESTPA